MPISYYNYISAKVLAPFSKITLDSSYKFENYIVKFYTKP